MKLLTKTLVLAIALLSAAEAFAQSPTAPASVTRQRKATTDSAAQTVPELKPATDPATTNDAAADQDKTKPAAKSTAVKPAEGPFTEPTSAVVAPTSRTDKSKSKDAT